MEFLERIGLDLEALPPWAASSAPLALKWIVVALSVLGIWLASRLVRTVIVALGRRSRHGEKEFEGSAWDIGASLSQFATLLLLAPMPLALAGFDAFAFFETYASGAVAAAVTLLTAIVVASYLAGSIRKFGRKTNRRAGADDTLFTFIASVVKYAVFAVAIVLALTQLGFQATSLVALVGAAGLAVGLALQDTLKSVAAGVMLAIFRPFRIGDWVEISGLDGEVMDITPFQTSIKQIDNKVVFVTNDRVWGEPLINYTRQTRRRLDLYFDVSYDDDLDLALKVLRETANDHGRVLAKDETWAAVHELADFSVRLRLRAWVATPEFIQVRADVTKAVKEAFDAAGITIPYPHQVEIQYRGRPDKQPSQLSDKSRETHTDADLDEGDFNA